MLREGDWKYIDSPDDICELYNLRQDPDELKNLAPTQATLTAEMKAKLREWCPLPVAGAIPPTKHD
jgi:arylsulfatase A-like enzyme